MSNINANAEAHLTLDFMNSGLSGSCIRVLQMFPFTNTAGDCDGIASCVRWWTHWEMSVAIAAPTNPASGPN